MIYNTENFYKTEKLLRKKYINPYGFKGLLYESDFEIGCANKRQCNGSNYAQRIISDRIFDELCRKHSISRAYTKENGVRYFPIW